MHKTAPLRAVSTCLADTGRRGAAPVEVAVQLFQRRLRAAADSVSHYRVARVHAAAAACMRTCLVHGSARDAFDVYVDYCSAGLLLSPVRAHVEDGSSSDDATTTAPLPLTPISLRRDTRCAHGDCACRSALPPVQSQSCLDARAARKGQCRQANKSNDMGGDESAAATPCATRDALSSMTAQAHSMSLLALQALQLLPDRVHQHRAVMQLLACEDCAEDATETRVRASGVVTDDSSHGAHNRPYKATANVATRVDARAMTTTTLSPSSKAPQAPLSRPAMAAAQCRVRVLQRLHVLHCARLLTAPLGCCYALAELQHVVASDDVRRHADAALLVRLSTTILHAQYMLDAMSPRRGRDVTTDISTTNTANAAVGVCRDDDDDNDDGDDTKGTETHGARVDARELVTSTTPHGRRPVHARATPSHGTSLLTVAQHEQLQCIKNDVCAAAAYDDDNMARGSTLGRVLRTLVMCAPQWDALLLRRAALTVLQLGDAQHAVVPCAPDKATRYHSHHGVLMLQLHDEVAADAVRGGSCRRHRRACQCASPPHTRAGRHSNKDRGVCLWADKADEVFAPTRALPTHTARAAATLRVEQRMLRRTRHDVVVPDSDFVMTHFDQLRRLARHREVVVTHGVLLDLVDVAASGCRARRFRARAVLSALMHATTTTTTVGRVRHDAAHVAANTATPLLPLLSSSTRVACASSAALLRRCTARRLWSHKAPHVCNGNGDDGGDGRHMQSSSSSSSSGDSGCEGGDSGGVTLLGLQDELALLALARKSARVCGGSRRATVDACEGDGRAYCCACSVVLMTAQLRCMLACHDAQTSLLTHSRGGVGQRWCANGADDNDDDDGDDVGGHAHRQQGRGQHAAAVASSLPSCVLLATTTPLTRRLAYMAGVAMYPPVSAHGW